MQIQLLDFVSTATILLVGVQPVAEKAKVWLDEAATANVPETVCVAKTPPVGFPVPSTPHPQA